MRINPDQLEAHLNKAKSTGLAPIYVVGGEETLVVEECADALRKTARELGYEDREVMHVETGFKWDSLLASGASMSLFSTKRIIEVRLPTGKPGDAGGKALTAYSQNLPEDTMLFVIAGKMEGSTRNSKWYKALDKAGATVTCWPVERRQLPQWITQRMRNHGLTCDRDVIDMMCDRVEGNLLAAAQEIDSLAMLHGASHLNLAMVEESVADNARFDVFGLLDNMLAGHSARALRMLDGLQAEGAQPVPILTLASREIRSVYEKSLLVAQGQPISMAIDGVWAKRKPAMEAALRRHGANYWARLLARCAKIDRVLKGAEQGLAWNEIRGLILAATYQRPARRRA